MLLQVPNLPESVLRHTGGGSEHTVLRLRGGMESGGQMRAEYLGIEPLNGQNYLRWKGKMKATLVLKGWDDAIDPPTPGASGSTPILSKNDAKALALIQLCVDESQMVLIRDCKTALEAWQLLEAHYRSSLQQQSVGKLKELSHLMKEQHESIEQYCNRAQKLWNEYLSGGSTYTSHQFLQQLLAGLPKVYDVTVTLLQDREPNSLTLATCLPKLLARELQLKKHDDDEAGPSNSPALMGGRESWGRGQGHGYGRGDRGRGYRGSEDEGDEGEEGEDDQAVETRRCYYCGKPGHLKRDCHAWLRSRGKQKAAKDDPPSL
jgi:hypothetical protein